MTFPCHWCSTDLAGGGGGAGGVLRNSGLHKKTEIARIDVNGSQNLSALKGMYQTWTMRELQAVCMNYKYKNTATYIWFPIRFNSFLLLVQFYLAQSITKFPKAQGHTRLQGYDQRAIALWYDVNGILNPIGLHLDCERIESHASQQPHRNYVGGLRFYCRSLTLQEDLRNSW